MKVVGFNFSKISIERMKDSLNSKEELKANTSIDVSEIKEVKSHILKTKEQVLDAKFTYGIKYDPGFAEINIGGNIIVTIEPKLAKEVLKQWKNKKMPEDFKVFLFNTILKKSTLKALYLEEELNLPLHMPLPSFKKKG
ncbi:MAG: hypothetical protein WDZ69_03265 [Candidatus Pacearchaeota archaeon]